MSLITRCPACSTMFKVVPDQLRISDGWVRCGQCDEVFDANTHLLTEAVQAREADPVANVPSDGEAAAQVQGNLATDAFDFLTVEPEPPAVPVEPHRVSLPDSFLDQSPTALSHFLEFPPDLDLDLDLEGTAEPIPQVTPESLVVSFVAFTDSGTGVVVSAEKTETEIDFERLSPMAGFHYVQADAQEPAAVDNPSPSFMLPVRAVSVWSRRWARVVLAGACAMMVAVLLLQLIVQERDRMAAMQPDTKPFLVAVCELTGCTLSPLRQIESLVIDSSSFAKVRSDVYKLNFTLKNTGQIDVATPALELTLTDMQDQPVVRRVFVASDFGIKQSAMVPGVELVASAPISVKLSNPSERISGYRLLAFYP